MKTLLNLVSKFFQLNFYNYLYLDYNIVGELVYFKFYYEYPYSFFS